MNELTTTLADIREHGPCEEGWTKLLANLGKTKADDEPLLFETVLDSNGLDDALWCLRALGREHQRTCRLFAVWCARQVQRIVTDERSMNALDVAERHANGEATDQELDAARATAWDAARAAAGAAAWDAARAAAGAAAMDAARAAARAAQKAKFSEICRAGQFVPDAKKEGAAQ